MIMFQMVHEIRSPNFEGEGGKLIDLNSRAVEITVAIAVKDRPDYLRIAVASVMAQRVLPKELIIVDDFSSKPVTTELFGDSLPVPLRILRNEPNLGAAASYNRAVREAACSIVAFLDSDDYFLPEYVADVSEEWAKRSPRPVCIATGSHRCTNDLSPYGTLLLPDTVTREALLSRGNFVGGCSALSIHRDAFLAVGGYPDERGAYDWGLMLRLSKIGNIATIQKSLVLYRSPSANHIPTDTKNFRQVMNSLFSIWRSLPRDDQNIAKPMITELIAYNLAQAGRTTLSLKMLQYLAKNYILPRKMRLSKTVILTGLILLIGNKTHDNILGCLARFRASARMRAARRIRGCGLRAV
jgi:glycosyltransferase involved in cell wall biosynthesis